MTQNDAPCYSYSHTGDHYEVSRNGVLIAVTTDQIEAAEIIEALAERDRHRKSSQSET